MTEPLWLVGYGSLLFKPPLHNLAFSSTFHRFSGYLSGYARRFWQSSYDNRGTPEKKGRVVTIIPAADVVKNKGFRDSVLKYELADEKNAQQIVTDPDLLASKLAVWGCIYYIPPKYAKQASEYLDLREKDGYSTHKVSFNVVLSPEQKTDTEVETILRDLPRNSLGEPIVKSVVYIGTTENESFVGPEDNIKTAELIRKCKGDSGPNIEYLVELNKSLQGLDPTARKRSQDAYLDELERIIDATTVDCP